MKTRNTFFYAMLALLLVALALVVMPARADGSADVTITGVNWHPASGAGSVDGASAQLVRTDSGISFTFHARELNPGHVVTTWVVVVNNPSACAGSPCTGGEIILTPDVVESDLTYGAGHVVGQSGNATFAGHVAAGALPNAWFGSGLGDPRTAEIHLVLHDHGPIIPSMASNMLQTFRGGCTDASLPAIFPATAFADGIPGPNSCVLYQSAVFVP